MRFDVLTLFPEMFSGYLGQSLLKLAIERGLVQVNLHNIRDWAQGKHKAVDDRPYGGGPGMLLKVEPVVESVEVFALPPLPPTPHSLPMRSPASRSSLPLSPRPHRRLPISFVQPIALHAVLPSLLLLTDT